MTKPVFVCGRTRFLFLEKDNLSLLGLDPSIKLTTHENEAQGFLIGTLYTTHPWLGTGEPKDLVVKMGLNSAFSRDQVILFESLYMLDVRPTWQLRVDAFEIYRNDVITAASVTSDSPRMFDTVVHNLHQQLGGAPDNAGVIGPSIDHQAQEIIQRQWFTMRQASAA